MKNAAITEQEYSETENIAHSLAQSPSNLHYRLIQAILCDNEIDHLWARELRLGLLLILTFIEVIDMEGETDGHKVRCVISTLFEDENDMASVGAILSAIDDIMPRASYHGFDGSELIFLHHEMQLIYLHQTVLFKKEALKS